MRLDLHHPARLRRALFATLVILVLFRIWFAVVLPFTGDEAYFYYWGTWPDWGFYDHPPMVGWWLALAQAISHHEWVLRLPAVLLPLLLAGGAAGLVREDPLRASAAALLVLLLPASVWNVAITTDTPLIAFSFLSGACFLRAARKDSMAWYAASGVLLGLALLSKYFAGLLAIAYAVFCLARPSAARVRGLAIVAAGALPFFLLNMWWNWQHCWANLMFNLYNRNQDAGLSWRTPLLYAATLAYLLLPPVIWQLWRMRTRIRALCAHPEGRALATVALLPLALFAALSLVKTIGMHWVLSFLPFVIALLLRVAQAAELAGTLRFAIAFAAAHIVAIATIAALPVDLWRDSPLTRAAYPGIVMTVKADEVLAEVLPLADRYVLAADGYSAAVTLSYNAGRYFHVFGPASSHARHDDILTDFRKLAGRDIAVLLKKAPQRESYAPYFRELDIRSYTVRGAQYWLVLGHGFDFAAYREGVIEVVRRQYYAIPRYLPAGPCYFCERYFPERQCRA